MSRRSVGIALSVAVSAALLPVVPAQAAGHTLVVDVAAPFRPVTHAASGGLYALAENNRPADSMLLPIKMHTLTQPAPGVGQRPSGQPPGGDSLRIAPQADRVGAAQVIRMPDIYPNFPYQWVSWDDWLSKVDTMVQARLNATSVSNVVGWEVWNEPDYTWNTAAAGDFNAGWVRTVQRIRTRDTVTPIVGPSYATYEVNRMRTFLTVARNNNVLPDVMVWHELNHSSAAIAANVASYRSLESSLGISPRPIFINEYAWTAYNDGAWSTVSYPPTAGWAQFGAVSTTVDLRAGYNVLRLAKGSPFFSGATGYAELDYLQLAWQASKLS